MQSCVVVSFPKSGPGLNREAGVVTNDALLIESVHPGLEDIATLNFAPDAFRPSNQLQTAEMCRVASSLASPGLVPGSTAKPGTSESSSSNDLPSLEQPNNNRESNTHDNDSANGRALRV